MTFFGVLPADGRVQTGWGGGGIVTPSRIGPLAIDRSTRADVIRFAGAPAADHQYWARVPGAPFGEELAYRCGTGCRTEFFINSETRRLSNFVSSSRTYRTRRGTRPHDPKGTAERLERRKTTGGCRPGIWRFARDSYLVVDIPRSRRKGDRYRRERRVRDLGVDSQRHSVLFCVEGPT